MRQHKTLPFVFIIFLLALSGCGNTTSNPPPDIVGRWEVQDKSGVNVPHSFFWFSMDYVEFRADGKVLGLMRWPPGNGQEIRLNKTARYTLRGDQIEFVGSCRHQDPCTGVYTLARTADTLLIFDNSGTLTLQWAAPPTETLPPAAPGPAPTPTLVFANISTLKQQLTEIHAPFEFDLSGCFITNPDEVPYSYEAAIEQIVTLLVSHTAQLSLDKRAAIFREVAGFEVSLFNGPDNAVLAVYPGNRGCRSGSHHFPSSQVGVADRAGNYWPIKPNKPGAVSRVEWIEDRWVLLINHKLNTFSGPDPAGVWHIGRKNGVWQQMAAYQFDPPPFNFQGMTVRFEQGYTHMVAEMSHWREDPPCRFNPEFKGNFILTEWRAEKRYRLINDTYQLLKATVLEVNIINKTTHQPATVDWADYCEEIP